MAAEIITGNSFIVLADLPGDKYDALISDPPYSSPKGSTKGQRKWSDSPKFKTVCMQNDDMDQRSWTNWTTEWLIKASRTLKVGSPIVLFSDWRQLSALSDAIRFAGFILCGIVPWEKVNARPYRGGFRNQCEYCLWGSWGKFVGDPDTFLPGIYRGGVVQVLQRLSVAQKPLDLMRFLVKITRKGGHILDPFCGSGTTLAAAVLEGYDATGIEIDAALADMARSRTAEIFDPPPKQ